MKKITLLLCLLFTFIITNNTTAQDLQVQNYDALTIGNVAGQGGMSTFSGVDSDYQIVNEGGLQGNVLQINGPADDASNRFLWTDGLDTSWSSRTSGNNFIEIEYEFYTGPATTSLGTTGMQLYNSDYSVTIGGFRFVPETKVLTGLAYYDNMGTPGLFFFNLGAMGAEIVLSPDTWYKIGFAFNTSTGEIIWKGPGFYTGLTGAAAGVDPFEVDFTLLPGTGNTVSTVAKFDALRIRATSSENLLGVNDIDNTLSESIKLYPNPANDVINLSTSNSLSINKLEIIDINGRKIKSIKNIINKEINISDLNKGLYLINIYSTDGMVTKKIIKQ